MKLDYDLTVDRIDGTPTTLADYRGRVLLIVNTASKCGFTPQYEGLQELWTRFREDGLTVLGFPCNQFGGQEPGEDEEVAEFCRVDFGVDFPMFSKIDVNGAEAHPLYRLLKEAAPGFLGTKRVKWNFTKFLVARDGTIRRRFGPATKPDRLTRHVERELDA